MVRTEVRRKSCPFPVTTAPLFLALVFAWGTTLWGCIQPRKESHRPNESDWVCIGFSGDSISLEVFEVLKAADIEASEGDGNLGIFALLVKKQKAERATRILEEQRHVRGQWFFIPIDEWTRKELLRRHGSEDFLEGKILLDRGEYARSIGYFDVSIQLQPNSDAYGARAYAWLQRGQLEKARADYDRALEVAGPGLDWTIPYYRELTSALKK